MVRLGNFTFWGEESPSESKVLAVCSGWQPFSHPLAF